MGALGLGEGLLVLVAIMASLVALAACYVFVKRLFRPIEMIKTGAVRIGNGDLNYRLPKTRTHQFNDLVMAINKMAGDLGELLEAKRQLLLAISHELRSPLTRARVSLEFVEESEVKADLKADIADMERLVTDLLESERLGDGHQTLRLEPVPLVEFLDLVLGEQFPDPQKQLHVAVPNEEFEASIDPVRIRLLIKNLVQNALRYAEYQVSVSLEILETGWQLDVADDGPGIPLDELDRLTEPFYRVDPSRQRRTGGIGLGLHLCRLIAEAHGGHLAIHSQPGRGTRVRLQMPAPPPSTSK